MSRVVRNFGVGRTNPRIDDAVVSATPSQPLFFRNSRRVIGTPTSIRHNRAAGTRSLTARARLLYQKNCRETYGVDIGSPVVGSRNNKYGACTWEKSIIEVIELEIASKEPCPKRCPPSQLSSINLMGDAWLVTV